MDDTPPEKQYASQGMSDADNALEATFWDVAPGVRAELKSLLADCYTDMRLLARRIMRGNALAASFQPTELANEVALRLICAKLLRISDKAHFLALAARTMRQVLIDEARKLVAAKRQVPLFLTAWPDSPNDAPADIEALDGALQALAALSAERAEIVELRFMLGMTVEEAAAASGLSARTVKRHWQAARAWLIDYMQAGIDGGRG
jgi:RNA polymerase sigma factor (TIGR02999 family)